MSDQATLPGKWTWLVLGCFCIVLSLLAFVPAEWLAVLLERQTHGRLTLGDTQGSLWNGSAYIGAINRAAISSGVTSHPDNNPATSDAAATETITALLPGRFSWHLSPMILLGHVDIDVSNAESLRQPLKITGNWGQMVLGASAVYLPAERLSSLGAPLNTLHPSGRMTLSWSDLMVQPSATSVELNGKLTLTMTGIASALSPIKPLGSYLMTFDWYGQTAQLTLATTQGPLLLTGRGGLDHGRLQFSGQATADVGQEEKLANLLNLLGQRHVDGAKNVIALEFK